MFRYNSKITTFQILLDFYFIFTELLPLLACALFTAILSRTVALGAGAFVEALAAAANAIFYCSSNIDDARILMSVKSLVKLTAFGLTLLIRKG